MGPLDPKRHGDEGAAAEAAYWHARKPELQGREQEQFARWLKESPRHLREFLVMETLSEELRHVDPQRHHDVAALLKDSARDVVTLRKAATVKSARPRGRTMKFVAMAASLAVLALAAWQLQPLVSGWQSYSTSVGEQRAIQLPDNSVVNLNTGSRLQVRFNKQARDIRLLEGEALFKVQRDATRPFLVHTDDAVIEAVGTQFNVHRHDGDTTVSVLEGRVRVTRESARPQTTALSAGEQVKIESDGALKRETSPDIASVTAWQQRRLVFREEALATIAAEFNRYNRAPRIRLEGMEGARHHYTGTFDADSPRSFALLLSRQPDLDVETTAAEIVIRRR